MLLVLIFLNCTNQKEVFKEHRNIIELSISDSITFQIVKQTQGLKTVFSRANERKQEYWVTLIPFKRIILFQNIKDETDKFEVRIHTEMPKYGYSDFFVQSRDSIFLVPDNGNSTNILELINKNGELTNSWDLTPNNFEERVFSVSSTPLNRIKVNDGVLFSNQIAQGFPLQKNMTFKSSGYYSLPHELVLDLNNKKQISLECYPEALKTNEYLGIFNIKTFKKDTLYLGFTNSPILMYASASTNYENFEEIDLSEILNFELRKIKKNDTQEKIMVESDMIFNIQFDEFRNLFYVLYSKGIAYKKDEMTTNSLKDKPVYFAVFDRNFNYLNHLSIGDNSNYDFYQFLISEKGLLLKSKKQTDTTSTFYISNFNLRE